MSVFFQFIAAFGLFFGIAGLVFATEVSRRCQLMINNRLAEIEADMARRMHKQDATLATALKGMRETITGLEDTIFSQSREIVALRKALEPLNDDLEKRKKEQELAQQRPRHLR